MRRGLIWALTALAAAWCIVIWSFSLQSGAESSSTSGAILQRVDEMLDAVGLENPFTPQTIRKTAHFCEFLLLGLLASAALRAHGFRHFAIIAFGGVFAVASIDELLQFCSPGRGPSFLDVLLDAAGGLCGIALCCLLSALIHHFHQKRIEKSSK